MHANPIAGTKTEMSEKSGNSIVPVFVLGMQRSGTTLAANLLEADPRIAAVSAEAHRGVHESVYFSHFARAFGPCENDQARARFIAAFASSDYFRLTGLSADWLKALEIDSYAAVFRTVMDAFAEQQGAVAWLEKSPHHTLLAEDLYELYPDGIFVCVTRDPVDLLRSRLWAYGRKPRPYPGRLKDIVRSCASSVYHTRYLKRFAARHETAFVVTFGSMRQDPVAALKPLFERLGLATPEVLKPRFAANSSFGSKAQKEQGLTRCDRIFANTLTAFLKVLPLPVLRRVQSRQASGRNLIFPDWVWTNVPPPDGVIVQRSDADR